MICEECGREFEPKGKETLCDSCIEEQALFLGAFFGILGGFA